MENPHLENLKIKLKALEEAKYYVVEIIGMAVNYACEEWVNDPDECDEFLAHMSYFPRMYARRLKELQKKIDKEEGR